MIMKGDSATVQRKHIHCLQLPVQFLREELLSVAGGLLMATMQAVWVIPVVVSRAF
jgi:hypothetical protein